MSGKGDSPRPSSVPKSVRDANWERTFGRYAEEQALAKRVAVDLRGVLAKLEDEPKLLTAIEAEARWDAMGQTLSREMDRVREMMQTPLLDALTIAEFPSIAPRIGTTYRATPCHDWPSRDQLPTTEPDDA